MPRKKKAPEMKLPKDIVYVFKEIHIDHDDRERSFFTAGRQFFVDFYSPNEAATVSVKKTGKNQLSLAYNSNTWGKATFESLEVQEANGRYILPTDAETTIVMERGAMGQQGGGGEYKLTLVEGSISTDLTGLKLVMSAFMNANHGSYELTFHEGDAPAPVVQ